MPARLSPKEEKRVQETAVAIYKALGCSGFARVDMFYTPSNEIIFNEVNTIPGLTSHSRYPNMMKGIGLSFAKMLDRLIGLYIGQADKSVCGMMKTVTLRKEQIYQGDLLLVNARHPYRDNSRKFYVSLNSRYEETLLSREAANALQLIFQKISSGNAIVPVSGYRTLEEQVNIYNTSLKDNGEEFTRKYVALPNHSEHQTGLAIDLGLNKPDIDFIRPDFPYGGICEEFRQAAPDYGFIERYAKDKESITGISHEPWHFRYVGYPHSKIITEQVFSLEEYAEFIKNYRDNSRLIFTAVCETEIEIYYVPANNNETTINIEENYVNQISGNNIDGFIVTVWRKNNEQELYGH